MATSAPRSPVFHEVEGTRREELSRRRPRRCRSTATHAAWPAVLEGVDEVLQSCTYPTRQLTIVTDLRKAGWDAGVSRDRPAAGREQGVRVRVVDVGGDETANVALESLVPLDRTILAGAESRWEAVIRNDSPRAARRGQGDPPGRRPADRGDAARDRPATVARVPLTVRFPGRGPHDLSLQLPEDELPGDNQRWAAVPVKDSLLIRLVDGEPSSEPFGSEVDYLAAPLSIGVGAPRPGASRSSRRRTSSRPGSSPPTCSSWPTSPPRRPSRPTGSAGSSAAGWA